MEPFIQDIHPWHRNFAVAVNIIAMACILFNARLKEEVEEENRQLSEQMKICEDLALKMANEYSEHLKFVSFDVFPEKFSGKSNGETVTPVAFDVKASKIDESSYGCSTDFSRKLKKIYSFKFTKDQESKKHTTVTREIKHKQYSR